MAPAVGILMGGARIPGMKVIFAVVEDKKAIMFAMTKGNVPLMKMEIASMVHIGPEADSFMTVPDYLNVGFVYVVIPRLKHNMIKAAYLLPVHLPTPPVPDMS